MGPFLTSYSEDLAGALERLKPLVEALKRATSLLEKIEILNGEDRVGEFFIKTPLEALSLEQELIIKSVLAIGQGEAFFPREDLEEEVKKSKTLALMGTLWDLETFYQEMGGIVGYHLTLLQFLHEPKQRFSLDKARYHAPLGLDLEVPSAELTDAIYYSIEKMEELSEMYPVGGAADRLKLQDSITGAPMPAALLPFNGRTMLEGLIEDLQAREYLYYKIKGRQITLPVAMMTSNEKDNHQHILRLCEERGWFARPKEKFAFFCQPLVPVVDVKGSWVFPSAMQPLLKPGGHGVIWKLARDQGVFSWLAKQGASKSIIRQINNPISSEDYGLLAFSGYGLKADKKFGFASCERQLKASEGINVVVEEESETGFSYTLTNIEYCDFQTYGIEDEPVGLEKKYSKFPSNTNLLFVDLPSVLEAIDECPIPGMLVNLKKVVFKGSQGERREEEVARLESTMQNMADCFSKRSARRLLPDELVHLDAYITFNKRRKTIAATKKEYVMGSSFLETPEGCFLDVMSNMRELLLEHCGVALPESSPLPMSFVTPPFLFYYHPALGPLYSLIGKKIRGGSLSLGSELHLHIAECELENVSIEGSLLVKAARVMGEIDSQGILRYSENVGRCILKNVRVRNKGVDYEKENVFWKKTISRKESCSIFLEGSSEFYAEDVLLEGSMEILVEDGFKLTVKEVEGQLLFIKEKLTTPSWSWKYEFDLERMLIAEKFLRN